MIRPRSGSYAVSVYDPALKRKRWVGTFRRCGRRGKPSVKGAGGAGSADV